MNDVPTVNQRYIVAIGLVGVFSWTAWLIVIWKLDPYASTTKGLPLFFISLLFALIATFTLLGSFLRRWLGKNEISYSHLSVSLRQSLLLSLCTVFCILFLMFGVLKWWNGLLLLAVAVLTEMFLTSRN